MDRQHNAAWPEDSYLETKKEYCYTSLLLINVVNYEAMTDVTASSDKETAQKMKANLLLLILVQLVIIKWS